MAVLGSSRRYEGQHRTAPGELDLSGAHIVDTYLGLRIKNWFDHYLKDVKGSPTGPEFSYFRDWADYTGTGAPAYGTAPSYPVGAPRNYYPSGAGDLVTTPTVVRSGSVSWSNPGLGAFGSYSEVSGLAGQIPAGSLPVDTTTPYDAANPRGWMSSGWDQSHASCFTTEPTVGERRPKGGGNQMRQLTRISCCTAAVVALTACGSQTASTTGSQTASTTGSQTAPTSGSQPSVFPLTITRTGGIAGFHDVLVVASDGLVSVTQKAKAPRQCQLTPDAAKRLTTAASQVPWPHLTPGKTAAAFPDDMVTMVLSPSGGPVRVEDPLVGAAGPIFNELVNDLNGGQSASGMCKPV